MNQIVLSLIIAMLFYLTLPGLGAFYVRSRWRLFRHNMEQGSLFPLVTYEVLGRKRDGFIGSYRFFGALEAIQGDDTIWLTDGKIFLSAELKKVSVYLLPQNGSGYLDNSDQEKMVRLPEEMPFKMAWDRIFSLPTGTKIFICGSLFIKNGKAVFLWDKINPLTVVIYDGKDQAVLRRSIWTGRQRNEYWNFITPGAITAGSFTLLIFSYALLATPLMRLPALFSLALSLIPILPFFPPGVALFFLYRVLWHQGRILRAERDMLRLPLRYLTQSLDTKHSTVYLPNGEYYSMRTFAEQELDVNDLKEKGAKPQLTSLLPPRYIHQALSHSYFVFGALNSQNLLQKPKDPMAEFLYIKGDPAKLAVMCEQRARFFELGSAGAFVGGLLLNLFLLFLLLRYLIK